MPLPDIAHLRSAADFLRSKTAAPQLGIILGSGLGGFADQLTAQVSIPYRLVPNMPTSSIQGHAGNFCGGRLGDLQVLCMQGRAHSYEGHPPERVVFGACLLAEMGCKVVLLTNAAGGVAPDLAPGDLMLIRDHIKTRSSACTTGEGRVFRTCPTPTIPGSVTWRLAPRRPQVSRSSKGCTRPCWGQATRRPLKCACWAFLGLTPLA
jgi:purine nucleoside phosphorylase